MARIRVTRHQLPNRDDLPPVERKAMLDSSGEEVPDRAFSRRDGRVQRHLRGAQYERAVIIDVVHRLDRIIPSA